MFTGNVNLIARFFDKEILGHFFSDLFYFKKPRKWTILTWKYLFTFISVPCMLEENYQFTRVFSSIKGFQERRPFLTINLVWGATLNPMTFSSRTLLCGSRRESLLEHQACLGHARLCWLWHRVPPRQANTVNSSWKLTDNTPQFSLSLLSLGLRFDFGVAECGRPPSSPLSGSGPGQPHPQAAWGNHSHIHRCLLRGN